MRPRCVELARVLKKTGSFYYHCDWHASHYVKVMLDQIFGENNFQAKSSGSERLCKGLAFSKFWPNNHDTIFYYGGGEESLGTSHTILTTRTIWMTNYRNIARDQDGRRYRWII